MYYPANATLPFFAYGAFRQGELAFLRIKPFVDVVDTNAKVKGEIRMRDGLLLLSPHESEFVSGHLMRFDPTQAGSAFAAIADFEPERQYEWSTKDVICSNGMLKANILMGKDYKNGSSRPDRDCKNEADPFFNEALEIVDSFAFRFSSKDGLGSSSTDFTNLLHLQMAYMLLWSSIERYVTLRYSLGDQVTSKIMEMAKEPTFQQELLKNVIRKDALYATNEPSDRRKKMLNSQNPKKSLEYYYQVRCNITHRGKAAFSDFDRLQSSLIELSLIFRACLKSAFGEAAIHK